MAVATIMAPLFITITKSLTLPQKIGMPPEVLTNDPLDATS